MGQPPANTSSVREDVSDIVQSKPKRTWRSYIWDSLDKSTEERRFLFKLDAFILTFSSLGYLIKNLDQSNINNAFVSGMKEDLQLYGNQLNYMQTLWTVGYVVGQVPSNLLLTRIRPSIWIPALELTWTILTFVTCRCNTAEQLYGIRFLVGLAESGFYPGMQYLIGCWYRHDELAKRSCIFHCSSALASMFSGYLMAAVYNLEGVGGYRGWQWLFIVDGIISLPIALAGFLMLPDMPENSKAFYLTEAERLYARKRMDLEGRKGRQPYTRAKIWKIFRSWHIYALSLLYILFNNGNNASAPAFAQLLKHSTDPIYEVWQINVYPTATGAVQVVMTLIYAWTSDSLFCGSRWPAFIIGGLLNILCYVSLAIWEIPIGRKWACLSLAGGGYGLSGIVFAWAHEICSDDNEERALVTGCMNETAYVFQAWLPLLIWQQVDAPMYRKGNITVACFAVMMIATALATRTLHRREIKQKASTTNGLTQDVVVVSEQAESPVIDVEVVHPKVVSGLAYIYFISPNITKESEQSLSVRRVAIIGAGVSGIAAAIHLKRAGLDVTVYERSGRPGGIWVFDERTPKEAAYPSTLPSTGDSPEYETLLKHRTSRQDSPLSVDEEQRDVKDLAIRFAPPGPCYAALKNNVSTIEMELSSQKWKPGTDEFVPHHQLAEYLQETAQNNDILDLIAFNTRVDKVEKKDKNKWAVAISKLSLDGTAIDYQDTKLFDAVVVANGNYHAVNIPDIPGLAEWQRRYPSRIKHSKGYRTSEGFQNQNVLLIGAGVSSMDIARDLGPTARAVFQSSRSGPYDLSSFFLPSNGARIGGIDSFGQLDSDELAEDGSIPATITLRSGKRLCHIHQVVLCTGYHVSFPFLRHLHADGLQPEEANEEALVTNGQQTHNLHKDIWYINDPTLAFIGVPYHVATWSLFEFQAMALAATLSGKASLPPRESMREEYNARLQRKGAGRPFHSLRAPRDEIAYVSDLVDMVNKGKGEGDELMVGHSQLWLEAYERRGERLRALFGQSRDPAIDEHVLASMAGC